MERVFLNQKKKNQRNFFLLFLQLNGVKMSIFASDKHINYGCGIRFARQRRKKTDK